LSFSSSSVARSTRTSSLQLISASARKGRMKGARSRCSTTCSAWRRRASTATARVPLRAVSLAAWAAVAAADIADGSSQGQTGATACG
jgi:hypothetical protein